MKTDGPMVLFLELTDEILASWWLIVTGVCLGVAAAVAILHFTPVRYQAEVRVDARSEGLSRDLVESTVSDDIATSLQSLRASVFAQEGLAQLIEDELSRAPADVGPFIASVSAQTSVFYRRGDDFFSIAYRDGDPWRAKRMVDAVASAYVEQNAESRAALAVEATRTLEELSKAVLDELQAQEAAIAEFEDQGAQSLPEQFPFNLQMLEDRRTALENNLQQQVESKHRVEAFRSQQAQEKMISAFTSPGDGETTPVQTADARLAQLERELQEKLWKYSENHPDVQRLERLIAELKSRQESKSDSATAPAPGRAIPEPTVTVWDADILREQRALGKLRTEESKLRSEIVKYERRVEEAPRTKRTLEDLAKGLQAKQQEYDALQRKIASAKSAQILEEDNKGIQFQFKPAPIPSDPISPQPIPIYGLGIAGGLAVFLGPLLAARLLSPKVASEAGLLEVSDIPIMARIPRISTPRTSSLQRRRRLRNYGFSLVSAVVLTAVLIGLG